MILRDFLTGELDRGELFQGKLKTHKRRDVDVREWLANELLGTY